MFQISRTTPALFLTAVTHKRLPIFQKDILKKVLCDAYDEVRTRHNILILAYVIMLDHVHVLVRSEKSTSEILRLLNGVSARRIIQFLKDNEYHSSLLKLRGGTRDRNHKHSVWHHHTDSFEVVGEDTFTQKVRYIHDNPVRAGLTQNAEDHLFSSARQWQNNIAENEPLITDHSKISWR